MTRKQYWQFFPVALALPILFASQVNWLDVHPWRGMAKMGLLFLFSLALLNATARRLHDAGEDTSVAFMPFAPFALLWVGYQTVLWGGTLMASVTGAWVFVIWLIALIVLIVLIPLHLITLFVSLMTTSSVLGLCLLPSQTDPMPKT